MTAVNLLPNRFAPWPQNSLHIILQVQYQPTTTNIILGRPDE